MRGIAVSPLETVGDMLDLYGRGLLGKIPGLGPRYVGEIGAALVLARLRPQRVPASCPGP